MWMKKLLKMFCINFRNYVKQCFINIHDFTIGNMKEIRSNVLTILKMQNKELLKEIKLPANCTSRFNLTNLLKF